MTLREETWPGAADYLRALRNLEGAFPGRPNLARGALVNGRLPGLPWSAAGANAIVFSLTLVAEGRVAVRCFTRRPENDVDERYRALGRYLQAEPCAVFAGFDWIDHAIVVDGKPWPILQMEWIDGMPLKRFIRDNVDRRSDLEQLSDTWRTVITDLERRQVAHGDLQHGNIIVASPRAMRFVDLDSVWCTSTASYKTRESGLPAYQHPERAGRLPWDHRIDRFSAIVIYVSLRALATANRPVDLLSNGDSLILSADDIKAASEQNAKDEAWEFLFASPAAEVRQLAKELHEACRGPLDTIPALSELLSGIPNGYHPPPTPPPPPGHLNTWAPSGASALPGNRGPSSPASGPPPPLVNRWDADAAGDGSGRRVRPQATHQAWGGTTPPPPQQGAGPHANQPWVSGPTAAPPPTPAPSGPGNSPWLPVYLVVGVLVVIAIILLAAL